jgi:tripartite-type tricarboxylate transporter receptor subunit TctC
MNQKKLLAMFMAITMLTLVVSGCAGQPSATGSEEPAKTTETEKTVDYPKQPVRIIVQYGAGGGVDVTARLLAKYAEKYLGQSIVVENVTGGSGVVGLTTLAASKPDGYTLGLIFPNTAVEGMILEGVTYSIDSFEPIVQINFDPAFVVTKKGGAYDKPFTEIMEMTKKDKLNLGVGALWQAFDFVKLLLVQNEGVEFTRVAYDGGGPVTKAVASGDLELGMQFPNEWISYYNTKELSGLAVAAEERLAAFPDVPTFKELGIDIGDMGVRRFLCAPKGIDPSVMAVIEEAFLKALADPELQAEYAAAGMSVLPAGSVEAKETLYKEAEILKEIVTKAGIKPGDAPQ